MIAVLKQTQSLHIAATVTIAAGAAAVYVNRKRRTQPSKSFDDETTEKTSKTKPEAPAPTNTVQEPPVVDRPEAARATSNKRVVVLVTSYYGNPHTRPNQERAMTILNGLKVGDDQLEILDGAAPANKEKRNKLFALSGIRAKYPQFFVVDQNDTTTFLADWEGLEAMNEMGSLKESLNLA